MKLKLFAISIMLILSMITLFSGCINNETDYIKYSNIQYENISDVDPNLISLDLYVPKFDIDSILKTNQFPRDIIKKHDSLGDILDNPFPVMIWVHGGGWRTGDKANNLQYKIPLFINAGWIFVTVNYRLSPYDIPSDPQDFDPNRVKYPIHEQDVAAAIYWVHEHIAEYGGDPNNISLMGHSAGAGIVSTIATNESFLNEYGLNLSLLKYVVSLDTAAYDIRERIENESQSVSLLYMNAFGIDPKVWDAASPINHVEPGKSIPLFFVVTRGSEKRINLTECFVEKLKNAGVYTELIYATGYSHSEVNKAIGNPRDKVITPALIEFLGLSSKVRNISN